MDQTYKQAFEELQDRVSWDEFERQFYARDLAPMPEFLSKLLFKTLPDCVIRPASAEDVAQVVKVAGRDKIPVTPRAGATTAFMNAVPVKSGIVLDLTAMKGLGTVDRENLTAEVYPGTSWRELNEELAKVGLTACSVPSSGESSTVGGWFNMEGYGIGSVKYGCFHDQVLSAEIVLADGQIVTTTPKAKDYPLEWFAGSEGTLGITTKLKIKVRELPEKEEHTAVEYDSIQGVQQLLLEIAKLPEEETPYNVHWSNPDFYYMLQDLGYNVPTTKQLVAVSFSGSAEEVETGTEKLTRLVEKTGGKVLEKEVGLEEWQDRFRSMRIKRRGPTLLAAEVIIPIYRLADFYQRVQSLKQKVAVYGYQLPQGRILLLILYSADETKPLEYLFLLAKTKRLYDGAFAVGGRPYGVGVWNAIYINRTLPPEQLAERKSRKKKLDPADIINPGKYYKPPTLLHPTIFGFGTFWANTLSSILGIGRGR